MSATKFTYDGTTVFINPGKKDRECMSNLEIERTKYVPNFPGVLASPAHIGLEEMEIVDPTDYIRESFPNTCKSRLRILKQVSNKFGTHPLKVGVVFCGRQAPGGQNIIAGLYDHLQAISPRSVLYGFIGGTAGLFSNNHIIITNGILELFRNQGGYDIIGRAADRIKDQEQQKVADTCKALQLNGLVLIGGSYTNTDAAHLAEFFQMMSINTNIIGVPADESRDMHSKLVETTVGFDTVTRTYSQLIGNLCTDGNSAKKYYYFIRLPGRHSDYTTLECALQTHPNLVLLSEEIRSKHISLFGLVNIIADFIVKRYSEQKKDFGVVLIPEGCIESIGELKSLIDELNLFMNQGISAEEALKRISPLNSALYNSLPSIIQSQLIISRESRGSIQLSQISTEKLLSELVKKELSLRKKQNLYKGTFTPVSFFFGYKARSALPTNFDCDLGYTLGRGSASLISFGVTGALTNIINLAQPVDKWQVTGLPLCTLMQKIPDKNTRAFIKPIVLNVNESPYKEYLKLKDAWVLNDEYINPGPVQFCGVSSGLSTKCLFLEDNKHIDEVDQLREDITKLLNHAKPGCSSITLKVLRNNVSSLIDIVDTLNHK